MHEILMALSYMGARRLPVDVAGCLHSRQSKAVAPSMRQRLKSMDEGKRRFPVCEPRGGPAAQSRAATLESFFFALGGTSACRAVPQASHGTAAGLKAGFKGLGSVVDFVEFDILSWKCFCGCE